MKYIQEFKNYDNMNEGLKNWITTFLILTGLGIVPPSVSLSQNRQDKKNFVENMDKDKLDAALFTSYLNSLDDSERRKSLDTLFSDFKLKNKDVKSNLSEVQKYLDKNGKNYVFNKEYIIHDYSNVDIQKFTPDNWLTDMGNMIEDSQEPDINNWISDYEKKTSVEIGIITINKLPENKTIDEYTQDQFRRLGVGKAGANNGLLIVLSKEDRKWFIQPGYGLEGLLPDITCSEIGTGEIVPHFRKQDYYGGIMGALEKVHSIIGDDVEKKKEWIRQRDEKIKREDDEFFQSVLEYTLFGLILLATIGSFVWINYKARLRRKKLKELKDNIDDVYSKIENIKSKFPQSPIFSESSNFSSLYKKSKSFLDEVTNLSFMIPNMIALMSSDLDQAIKSYEIYDKSIQQVISKTNKIATKLKNIESAISRIKSWNSEIDPLLNNFKTANGSMSTLNNMIDKFKNNIKISKDWFKLCEELDSIKQYINSVISQYEYEQRRKREEEERQRRIQREEEERRNSYSSSSSSSSSSFGGFGGGSSGGAGAGGSW